MSTVSIHRRTVRASAAEQTRATARDMRALMRDQGVSPAALAWTIRRSRLRSFRLRYWSTSWTLPEVLRLVEACSPASKSVPVWGVFAGVAA